MNLEYPKTRLLYKKIRQDKKLVVFGGGTFGEIFMSAMPCDGRIDFKIVDNNTKKWGGLVFGVTISDPSILIEDNEVVVLVACKNNEAIVRQLASYGVCVNNIIYLDQAWELISLIWEDIETQTVKNPYWGNKKKVLFDLNNGLVMGGVETWSFETKKILETVGYECKYFVSDKVKHTIVEEISSALIYRSSDDFYRIIAETVNNFAAGIYVCNFAGRNFLTMCFLKKVYGNNIKVIAIVHSDDEGYYRAYCPMNDYIDAFFAISQKIYDELNRRGIPKEKIHILKWVVRGKQRLVKKTHKILRIGYAGRIEIQDKRADLLLQYILGLKQSGIAFEMEIAGEGSYFEEFKARINQSEVSTQVKLLGRVKHSQILDFWKDKDIMIGCSDVEGHSITQVEAMYMGAVPIITRTSGACDDVEDGVCGYTVNLGDVDSLIYYTTMLEDDREKLHRMSRKARKKVLTGYRKEDFLNNWERIVCNI